MIDICVTEINPAHTQVLKQIGIRLLSLYYQKDWKRLKSAELQVIFDAGLKAFPIYKTYACNLSYFKIKQGRSDSLSTFQSAEDHSFSKKCYRLFSCGF